MFPASHSASLSMLAKPCLTGFRVYTTLPKPMSTHLSLVSCKLSLFCCATRHHHTALAMQHHRNTILCSSYVKIGVLSPVVCSLLSPHHHTTVACDTLLTPVSPFFFFFFSSVSAVGEALPSRCVHADLFKDMKNQISYLDWCTCIAMMISLSSPNNGALAFSLPPSLIHCHPPSQFPTHLAQQLINPDLLSLCSVTLSTSRHALAALFYFFFFFLRL